MTRKRGYKGGYLRLVTNPLNVNRYAFVEGAVIHTSSVGLQHFAFIGYNGDSSENSGLNYFRHLEELRAQSTGTKIVIKQAEAIYTITNNDRQQAYCLFFWFSPRKSKPLDLSNSTTNVAIADYVKNLFKLTDASAEIQGTIGFTPFQAKRFLQCFRILKTKRMIIDPGRSVQFRRRTPYWYKYDQLQYPTTKYYGDYKSVFLGCLFYGGLAKDDAFSTVSYGSGELLSQVSYHYTWYNMQDSIGTQVINNDISTTFTSNPEIQTDQTVVTDD